MHAVAHAVTNVIDAMSEASALVADRALVDVDWAETYVATLVVLGPRCLIGQSASHSVDRVDEFDLDRHAGTSSNSGAVSASPISSTSSGG
jgi:hypothetical protein